MKSHTDDINTMARKRKPKSIEVGKCYRLAWFGLPSDTIAYVYAIEGRKQRTVRVQTVAGPELGWTADSYTHFLRSVHSETPTTKN